MLKIIYTVRKFYLYLIDISISINTYKERRAINAANKRIDRVNELEEMLLKRIKDLSNELDIIHSTLDKKQRRCTAVYNELNNLRDDARGLK